MTKPKTDNPQAHHKKFESGCMKRECEVWRECGGACHDVIVRQREEAEQSERAMHFERRRYAEDVKAERERARSLYYQFQRTVFGAAHIATLATRLERQEAMVTNLIVNLRNNKIPFWVCPRCGSVHKALDERAAARLCESCLASEPDPWAEEKK